MSRLHGYAGGGNQMPKCILYAPALSEAVRGGGQQVVRLKLICQSIYNDPLQQFGQSRD